jgi:hypothetical protein
VVNRTGAIGSTPSGDTIAYLAGDDVVRMGAAGDARVRLRGRACAPNAEPLRGDVLALAPQGNKGVIYGVGSSGPGLFSGSTEGTHWFASVACAFDFERGEAQELTTVYPAISLFGNVSAYDARVVFGASGRMYVWQNRYPSLLVVTPEDPTHATMLGEMHGHCHVVERARTVVVACIDRLGDGKHRVEMREYDLALITPLLAKASVEIPLDHYTETALSPDGKTFAYSATIIPPRPWQRQKHLVGTLDVDHLEQGVRTVEFDGSWNVGVVGFAPKTGELLVADGGSPENYGLHALRAGAKGRRWKMGEASATGLYPIADSGDVWVVTVPAIYRLRP